MIIKQVSSQVKDLSRPLAIQQDEPTKQCKYAWTIILFPDRQQFKQARDQVVKFATPEYSSSAELVYQVTNVTLWNARAKGLQAKQVIETLEQYNIYSLTYETKQAITVLMNRYGLLELQSAKLEETFFSESVLKLVSQDPRVLKEAEKTDTRLAGFKLKGSTDNFWFIWPEYRGPVKNLFAWAGFPIKDKIPKQTGTNLNIKLRKTTLAGKKFTLKSSQKQAVRAFLAQSEYLEGVIIKPPGTGKTIVTLAIMARLKTHTLIVVKDVVAIWRWKHELLDKTNLTEAEIGEYWAAVKQIRPITITTYHTLSNEYKSAEDDLMLIERVDRCRLPVNGEVKTQASDEPALDLDKRLTHIDLFNRSDWGLTIFEEVHVLPANTFRLTAQVQSTARLGLTATPVREDGRELDIFSLVGPVVFNYPWKQAERYKLIPKVQLHKVIIGLSAQDKKCYAKARRAQQRVIAWENSRKVQILKALLDIYQDHFILIFGELVSSGWLKHIADELQLPFIHGQTPYQQRQAIYDQFRAGQINCILLTRIGDMDVDLPQANVGIQLNCNYGSRQQEGQRLGRLLRAKEATAHLFALVSDEPIENGQLRAKRESWLVGHGYEYLEEDETKYLKEVKLKKK